MKLILFALLAARLVMACTSANVEYDYEEESAAGPTIPAAVATSKQTTSAPTIAVKSSKLGGLLSPRSRGTGPLAARKSIVATQTTVIVKSTTTTEQPAEQYDDYEENDEEGSKQDVSTTTTTEPSKKLGRGGVVRPFRSNEDLLAALKRRRAQGVTSNHPREPSTTQISAETTQSKSKSQSIAGRSKVSNANEVPKSMSRVRFGGSRTKTATTNQEEAQETQSENVQVKLKAYRRG